MLSPFLHGGVRHLAANTAALFPLIVITFALDIRRPVHSIIVLWLFQGALVWLLGSHNAVYVGASGIVFALIGFLLTIGFVRREWQALMISLLVFALYNGALLSLLHHTPGVSWLSHASGFACGVLVAYKTRRPPSVSTTF